MTPARRRVRERLRTLVRHPAVRPVAGPLLAVRRGYLYPVPPPVRAAERKLRLLSRRRGLFVAGPWPGTVATELLYWIPFLRWARDRFRLDSGRMFVATAHAPASWYSQLAAGVLSESELEGDRIAPRLSAEPFVQLCEDYWSGVAPVRLLFDRLLYEPIVVPMAPELAVPGEFVVVQTGGTAALPESVESRELFARLLRGLAEQLPVVLLGPGEDVLESGAARHGRVQRPFRAVDPSRQLEVWTPAIGRARALVCPYGELALLGVSFGVPTLALYSEAEAVVSPDADIVHRAARAMGTELNVLDVAVTDVLAWLVRTGLAAD